MTTLRTGISYQIVNTFTTSTNGFDENRAQVELTYLDTESNSSIIIATLNLSLGSAEANDSSIMHLLSTSIPQYFV